jgi:hypothetical protein
MANQGHMYTYRILSRCRPWLAWLGAGGAAAALAASILAAPPAPAEGERFGVDQLRIMRTATGHLLDLRYRIVDPERAAPLLAKDTAVYVVHERSGARLRVPSTPKAGPLRNTGVPRAGRAYFALFSNPGGLVQRGDEVSVVAGELTTKLTVE